MMETWEPHLEAEAAEGEERKVLWDGCWRLLTRYTWEQETAASLAQRRNWFKGFMRSENGGRKLDE